MSFGSPFGATIADQLDTDHQAKTAHIADHLVPVLELEEPLLEIRTDRQRVFGEVVGGDVIEVRQRRRGRDRVAAEGREAERADGRS